MKALHIGISTVVLVSLAGCGSMGLGNKRIDYRSGAAQVPALEIPPDLTAPAGDDNFKVPGAANVATYSDYSKGGVAVQAGRSAVLPEVKGVQLQRNGAQRWLVVGDKAENVWPVVRAFFQENGLTIASEDQAAGVMETDWAENRAKIPQDAVRSVLGKVFDGLYSSGQRDQYRARLERAKDGASTEVYLTHRGMEEVLSSDGTSSKWQTRPADPEMEAVMLQKLMVRFGGSEVQAASAVNSSGTAAPSGAVVGGDGKASLLEVFDGSKVLTVNDAFDKAWRRVGLALDQAGLAVEDKDRAKGIYFLRSTQAERSWVDDLMFWKDDTSSDRRYRVNVKDGGASCEVRVVDQDDANDDVAAGILEKIYKHIGQ
ncbi:MAG TPA: outer membrane protein assembly factor BamC [Gallionella sp.]|nr:outer membrane protein assembly factor BamC [Gallionella sp.]